VPADRGHPDPSSGTSAARAVALATVITAGTGRVGKSPTVCQTGVRHTHDDSDGSGGRLATTRSRRPSCIAHAVGACACKSSVTRSATPRSRRRRRLGAGGLTTVSEGVVGTQNSPANSASVSSDG
jgi:hypothetical protein